jgi:hypothetical protein
MCLVLSEQMKFKECLERSISEPTHFLSINLNKKIYRAVVILLILNGGKLALSYKLRVFGGGGGVFAPEGGKGNCTEISFIIRTLPQFSANKPDCSQKRNITSCNTTFHVIMLSSKMRR